MVIARYLYGQVIDKIDFGRGNKEANPFNCVFSEYQSFLFEKVWKW